MNKNPFSIYDFMGYLFPGVVCYFFLSLLVQFDGDFSKLTDIAEIKDVLSKNNSRFDLDRSVVFVVFSYILGHIVSYVSSLTIEQFAIKVFGYPSTYLLEKEPKIYGQLWRDFFFKNDAHSSIATLLCIKKKCKCLLKILIFILIFPVSFTVYTFGYLFDLNNWVVRPLDEYLIESIRKKQFYLAHKLQISHPDVNDTKCDYHRIIQHYVYLNIPNSQKKIDNYVALYGFLRCMSLIFSMTFASVALYGISTIKLDAAIDWHLCMLLCILYFMAYLTFLGFMKFYRRFALENYMTLLSGMNDVNEKGSVG